ncbi:MAG: bifunctional DNA primase/polymerase, partial [Methanosarcinales archaeon]
IKYKNKNPIWNNWTEYCLKPAPNFDSTFYNIGVTCGYSSFHAIDFDTPEGYESFKCYLQEIGIDEKEILAHSARRDLSHRTLYFRDVKGRKFIGKKLDTEKYKTKKIDLEVCGVGNQILVPPSVHPNGNQYKFINLGKGKIYEVDLKELIENYYKKNGLEVSLEEYKEFKTNNCNNEIELNFKGNNNLFLDYEIETNTLLKLIEGAPCESNFLEHRYHSNYALGSIIMQKCNGNIETSFKIWCNLFGNYEDHNEKRTLQYLNYIKRDLDRGKKVGKNGYIKKHGICNCNCGECWIDKFLEDKNINTLKFKIGHKVEIGKPIDISKMPKYDNQRIEMNQGLIFKTIQKIKDPYKEMALIKTMPGSGKTRTVMEFMNGRNDCIYVAPSHDLINRSGFSGIHIYGMRYLCPKIQEELGSQNNLERTKTEKIIEKTTARFYCFKWCEYKGKCTYWKQYDQDFANNNVAIVNQSLASRELHKILLDLFLKKNRKKYLFLDDVQPLNLLNEDVVYLEDIELNLKILEGDNSFAGVILREIFEIYKNVLNGTYDKSKVSDVFKKYTNLITGNTKNRYSIMPYYINKLEKTIKSLFKEYGDDIDINLIPKDLSKFLINKQYARFKVDKLGRNYIHYRYSTITESNTTLDGMHKVILNATGIEEFYKTVTKVKKVHVLEDKSIFKNIEAHVLTDAKYTRAHGSLYKNKKLINNVVDLVNKLREKNEKILIKCPKEFIPVLQKYIGKSQIKYSVDFSDHGSNEYQDCTTMIKIGDIEPPVNLIKEYYEIKHRKKKWNGERELANIPYLFKNKLGSGLYLKTPVYKNPEIRRIADSIRDSEMKQSIGRLRSENSSQKKKVFMFSSMPYNFLVPVYCGTYETFKAQNLLDKTDNSILEAINKKEGTTTEQLFNTLKKLGINISKATLYNRLKTLIQNKILKIKEKLARGLRIIKINFNLFNLLSPDSNDKINKGYSNLESDTKNILDLLKKWLFY